MRLSALHFIALDGAAPAGTTADALPAAADVRALVERAFAPYRASAQDLESSEASAAPVLIYCYGHAWLVAGQPFTATARQGMLGAAELMAAILPPNVAPEQTIIVLDCCHAEAFDAAFSGTAAKPWLAVYASGAAESAISLTGERASRLSLSFFTRLSRRRSVVDLVQVVCEIAHDLDRNQVIQGQSVSYRMHGPRLTLTPLREPAPTRRERAVARIRNAFIGAGAFASLVIIAGAWYYYEHVLVEIDLARLPSYASDVVVSAFQEDPNDNGEIERESVRQPGNVVRMRLPMRDLIIRIRARYQDSAPRALAFHLDLRPSFMPDGKFIHLKVPERPTVEGHPGMAYVPAVPAWYHGHEREARASDKPFWIDISPPTQASYLAYARASISNGSLTPDDVLLIKAQQTSGALDATGLDQVRGLSKDLGAIFGAIAKSSSSHVAASGDAVAGTGASTCPDCPALMYHKEAETYCAARGMRLPSDLEWELAVRGVDGRDYPWGNRFDGRRANVPGLPAKGAPAPALKPVDAYPGELSPFGLIDTVGNAGDWVRDESGSYETVYMGATYRFEPEDATAYRMLPVTDEDLTMQDVTARCAVGP